MTRLTGIALLGAGRMGQVHAAAMAAAGARLVAVYDPVTSNWLLSGYEIDAIVANNDEMAIGAIMSLGPSRVKKVIVGGVDATPDGLAFLDRGMLGVTVFQDAKGQGTAAIDTAVRMARGEAVEKEIMIPFELVTTDNYKDYVGRN